MERRKSVLRKGTAIGLQTQTQVRQVRLSLGTAMVLGLMDGRMDVSPTTAYLLTQSDERCSANCAFCPQAKQSRTGANMLSRVTWPPFNMENVARALETNRTLKRVCVQAANYSRVLEDILSIVRCTRSRRPWAMSVSCHPISRDDLLILKETGVERVAIPLDAASEETFQKVKGKEVGGQYTWQGHQQALRDAVAILGRGKVTTHLIVGLGETDLDLAKILQRMNSIGVLPALFAFTPIRGTLLEKKPPPNVLRYRRIQLLRHFILEKGRLPSSAEFDSKGMLNRLGLMGEDLDRMLSSGEPFLTSGCPDCNRPYYNERPGGTIYNYPRSMTTTEISEVRRYSDSL